MSEKTFEHPHWVEVTICPWSVDVKAVCHAPKGSECREVCQDLICENTQTQRCTNREHYDDYGSCLYAEGINDIDAVDTYAGQNDHPLYTGPIRVWWDDEPRWEYLDAHPVVELALLYRKVMELNYAKRGASVGSGASGGSDPGRGMSGVQSDH